jgi:hypothetical protein
MKDSSMMIPFNSYLGDNTYLLDYSIKFVTFFWLNL